MFIIDVMSRIPVYEQIINQVETNILRGILKPGDKMPSVRNLAVELSINPNTIQRAYAELERQGYIYTVKGKGNFVSDSSHLLARYREEIFAELKSICKTAFDVGITEEEIIRIIKGGEAND